MRKIFLFMMVSLDGYFEGPDHDLSWHNVDSEFNEFAIKQLHETDTLLFGRRTYEMMASYWSTENAINDDPEVAALMNKTAKVVFSHSLQKATWENTKLVSENVPEMVKKLQEQKGLDIGIFGSNALFVNLVQENLVDEYRIIVNPILLGKGTQLFSGLQKKLPLQLVKERTFHSGNVLLTYKPEHLS